MTLQKWLATGIIIIVIVFCEFNYVYALNLKSVGKVVAVRGDAMAMDKSGTSRKLVLNGAIFREDVLITGKNGRIQILFADQTLISLGRNTEMEIVHYAWANDKKSGAMTTRVKEGAFRIMGGAITRNSPRNFKTETPAATIGIRGSLYAGVVIGDSLSILFQGGTGLDIITPFGSVPLITPGFGCKVAFGEAPSPPHEFSPAELQQINNQFIPHTPTPGIVAPDKTGNIPSPADNQPPSKTAMPDDTTPPLPSRDPLLAAVSTVSNTVLNTNTLLNTTVNNNQPVDNNSVTPQPLAFTSGHYLNTLVDDGFWYGPITGGSENGVATGQSVTQDSTVFPITFPFTTLYAPAIPYTGKNSSFGNSRLVNLRGANYTFPSMAAHSGIMGEFGYFSTADSFVDGGGSFNFWEFGFAGKDSTIMPTNGIFLYAGDFLGISQDIATSAQLPAITGNMIMIVNWLNSKVYGFVNDGNGQNIQFFGDVTGNTLAGVTLFSEGAEATGSIVKWYEGTQEFASFYGSNAQGFGMTSLGRTYTIGTQSLVESWRSAGAAFLNTTPRSVFSPTGSIILDGMVVALSENMLAPDSNRRHFMSHPFASLPTTFSLNIDRDAGIITTGLLNAVDLLNPNIVLKNINVGISNESAYIDYNIFAAKLGCTGNNCIETPGSPPTPKIGGLKTYGNYLSADGGPGREIANHVSWGYWEIAYDDPTLGQPYHLHIPYSLWIAGEKTPATDIVAKGVSSSFTGHYMGRAYGSRVDTGGLASELTNGATNLNIDFRPDATAPVSGTISFDQANLTVFGTAPVTTGGFQAQISAAAISGKVASPVSTSEVNGFFFEPGAISIGGNFSVLRADGEQLLGIMGGDIQP